MKETLQIRHESETLTGKIAVTRSVRVERVDAGSKTGSRSSSVEVSVSKDSGNPNKFSGSGSVSISLPSGAYNISCGCRVAGGTSVYPYARATASYSGGRATVKVTGLIPSGSAPTGSIVTVEVTVSYDLVQYEYYGDETFTLADEKDVPAGAVLKNLSAVSKTSGYAAAVQSTAEGGGTIRVSSAGTYTGTAEVEITADYEYPHEYHVVQAKLNGERPSRVRFTQNGATTTYE